MLLWPIFWLWCAVVVIGLKVSKSNCDFFCQRTSMIAFRIYVSAFTKPLENALMYYIPECRSSVDPSSKLARKQLRQLDSAEQGLHED